ncbi:antitoxin Xre/MbcA/ParS toxin-binding domain-containing protein [Microvirga sp. TS319]|uniref:antitoxin Xre/MbcA/ParS toxin-binding domain-containing protein n=1 Tax=Microvirga sp. TS319 TaxID=3241165 RepID=UPI00351A8E8B
MSANSRNCLMVEDATIIAKALTRIAAWLDLSNQDLRAIIGVVDGNTVIASLASNEAASTNALLLIQLHVLLTGIVGGDAGAAGSWLKSYNVALEARPLELMQQRTGLKRVADYLESRGSVSL